jgi:hypothetical protein
VELEVNSVQLSIKTSGHAARSSRPIYGLRLFSEAANDTLAGISARVIRQPPRLRMRAAGASP